MKRIWVFQTLDGSTVWVDLMAVTVMSPTVIPQQDGVVAALRLVVGGEVIEVKLGSYDSPQEALQVAEAEAERLATEMEVYARRV